MKILSVRPERSAALDEFRTAVKDIETTNTDKWLYGYSGSKGIPRVLVAALGTDAQLRAFDNGTPAEKERIYGTLLLERNAIRRYGNDDELRRWYVDTRIIKPLVEEREQHAAFAAAFVDLIPRARRG